MTDRISLAFAGALHHDGKLVYAYYQVDDRGVERGDAVLYEQALSNHDVGAVCSFQTRDNGRVIIREDPKFLRKHQDTKSVAEWVARHDATMTSERAWQLPFPVDAFSCASPIREAYRRLDGERRGVLLAQLVRYLESSD